MRRQKAGSGSVNLLWDGGSREVVVVSPEVTTLFLSQCLPSEQE